MDETQLKWRVTYRTVNGGKFVRLWPSSYGKTPADVKRTLETPQMLRHAHQVDNGSDPARVRRAEQTKVIRVGRSTFHG